MSSALQKSRYIERPSTSNRPRIKKGRNRETPKGTFDVQGFSEDETWARNQAAAMNGEAYLVDLEIFGLIAEMCCSPPAAFTPSKPRTINQGHRTASDEETRQIIAEIENRRSRARGDLSEKMLQAVSARDSSLFRRIADHLDRMQSTGVADPNANHIQTHYRALRDTLGRLPTMDELKQRDNRLGTMDKGQFSKLTKKLGLKFTPQTLFNKLTKIRGKGFEALPKIRAELRSCKAASALLRLSDDALMVKLEVFGFHLEATDSIEARIKVLRVGLQRGQLDLSLDELGQMQPHCHDAIKNSADRELQERFTEFGRVLKEAETKLTSL